jgi:hypothetical protein
MAQLKPCLFGEWGIAKASGEPEAFVVAEISYFTLR